jgi:hypothetical protein
MKHQILTIFLTWFLFGCGEDISSSENSPIGPSGVSQGGSLARFTIVDNFLYVVNDFSLVPIEISTLAAPVVYPEIELGFGVETIFPYQGNLFIGSVSAVYIFTIEDPKKPTYRSTYFHQTGCDPVVVSNDYAYVTLREGNSCGNFFELNVMEILDVSDLDNPIPINTIQMNNPRGLGVGCGNRLFVCDGPSGLVEFDLSDPGFPNWVRTYDEYPANDIIIRDSLLIQTGERGIYQYNCSGDTLELLSILPLAL